eukprot:gene5144-6822_t
MGHDLRLSRLGRLLQGAGVLWFGCVQVDLAWSPASVALLAFALATPADDHRGALEFAAGLSDTDEPDLWQRDLTGELVQWIEVGQPDDRRLAKACGRAEQVRIWSYSSSTPIWWAGIENKVARLANLEVWQVPADASRELAALAARGMQLQVTVQEGQIWVGNSAASVSLEPVVLKARLPTGFGGPGGPNPAGVGRRVYHPRPITAR